MNRRAAMHMLPLPKWSDLARSLLRRPADDVTLARPWTTRGGRARWFSRSAWSLVAVVKCVAALRGKPSVVVWLPDYFCNEPLGGVRALDVVLAFYPLDDALNPDWDACALMASAPPDLFVIVHYFGREADLDGARLFCATHDAVLIEDAAHVLVPTGSIGQVGDFVMYSPHKHLPIPDGAVLVMSPQLLRRYEAAEEMLDAAASSLPAVTPPVLPWLVRRFGARLIAGLRSGNRPPSRSAAPRPVSLRPAARTSRLARRMLSIHVPRLDAYGWCRVRNAHVLSASACELAVSGPRREHDYPYLLELHPRSAEARAALRNVLDRARLPSMAWPDLPPEILERPGEHAAAVTRARERIFLPVHQALPALPRFGTMSPSNGRAPVTARVRWDPQEGEWVRLFGAAPGSHLQQSRAYAEATALHRGWAPRYGILEISGQPVAVFVALEKRGPFGSRIARLNRGPVWLRDELGDADVRASMDAIADEYRLLAGRLFLSAPNVPMSELASTAMVAAGFRQRVRNVWHSSRVDLGMPPDVLRQRLDRKWRNQLVAAERRVVVSKTEGAGPASDWLLTRHRELMRDRSFTGPAPDFIRQLITACAISGQPYGVFTASVDSAPVAAISIVRHGTTATYLLGWCGDSGRAANATNALLWAAMTDAREQGCRWLDLGGLNERGTPGITTFKRGVKGAEYRLTGEYMNAR